MGGGRIHFGYLVVLAMVLTSFVPLSLGLSCAGIFYTPLSAQLGVGAGVLSYYTSILWIAGLAALPFLGRLLATVDARLCVGGAILLAALDFAWLSLAGSLWQYFVGAALMGLVVDMLLFLAPSTLINRWFADRAGFLIGIAMAFTGIGGVVWSTVGGMLIESVGWAATYRVFAVLTLATLPAGVFMVATSPESKGLAPCRMGKGAGKGGAAAAPAEPRREDVPARVAFKTPTFFLLMAMCFFLNFGMYVYFMIPSYCATLPIGVAMPLLGATASSVAMAGQTISKIVLGAAGDHHPHLAAGTGVALGLAGIGLLAAGGGSAALIYLAAFVFGFFYGVTNVMMPILTKRAFGVSDYPTIYARVSMAASFGGAASGFLWGTIIDVTGGFGVFFIGAAAFVALTFVTVVVLARLDVAVRT